MDLSIQDSTNSGSNGIETLDRPLNDEWYKTILPAHTAKCEILHFNDVYDLEGKDEDVTSDKTAILGGAARFKTALDAYNSESKLVVFSGDIFFPSILSNYFEGQQMLRPF